MPAEWKPPRRAQIDRAGRWTIKLDKKRETPPGCTPPVTASDRGAGVGYKNHVRIDREHGLLRRYSVTHAAAHDGGHLGAVLDRDNTAGGVSAIPLSLGREPGLARAPRPQAAFAPSAQCSPG